MAKKPAKKAAKKVVKKAAPKKAAKKAVKKAAPKKAANIEIRFQFFGDEVFAIEFYQNSGGRGFDDLPVAGKFLQTLKRRKRIES